MNLGLVHRAIDRHRYMKDGPAYREFLEEVRGHGDVWCVPQGEIARWWERRQMAAIALDSSGELRTDLEGAVVEVDGQELRVPPFSLDSSSISSTLPSLPHEFSDRFTQEVMGHLGFSHLLPNHRESSGVNASRLRSLLQDLRRSAVDSQRFDEEPLGQLRELLRDLHQACGLPELRIWPLPHRKGRPYRVAVSTRYDVDKAIVNLPFIHSLEEEFGLRSTVYLRPMGMFYGDREVRRYVQRMQGHEIALHGEFVTTAEQRFGSEEAAAVGEKEYLSGLVGQEVEGVCMHGGELRTNTTPQTRDAIEAAGYRYETMFRNRYYLPLHLPVEGGARSTLSIGQHFADITVPGQKGFSERLRDEFLLRFTEAAAVGGVFVPVMHPLYFGVRRYLGYPENVVRIAIFLPTFAARALKMKAGQAYSNPQD